MGTLQDQVDILREILRNQIDKYELAEQRIQDLTKRVQHLEELHCSHISHNLPSSICEGSSSATKVCLVIPLFSIILHPSYSLLFLFNLFLLLFILFPYFPIKTCSNFFLESRISKIILQRYIMCKVQ